MLNVLKTIFGIGVAGAMLTLLGSLISGIVNSGLYKPSTFPSVLAGTFTNLGLWGGALGGAISAMLGVLFVFVTLRIVVTLL